MEFLLSICIPTYNRSNIVADCVKNCLSWNKDWIEVSVTDNCSTDDTFNILGKIHDKRFHYHKNDSNIGYGNLMQCMKNGNGKYCLLLSDEDDLIDIEWDKLEAKLRDADNVSVFQFKYYDENGKALITGPSKIYESDSYEGYVYAKTHFPYAGGTILNKSVLDKIWSDVDKNTYLWSLYCEIIIPFFGARYGRIELMDFVSAKRTNRNNKSTIDSIALNGLFNEPYWSLKSRRKQFLEWFDLLSDFNTNDVCKNRLLIQNRDQSVHTVYYYYSMIHTEEFANSALAAKNPQILERDLNISAAEWIRKICNEKQVMNDAYKRASKQVKKKTPKTLLENLKFELRYISYIIRIILKNQLYKRY